MIRVVQTHTVGFERPSLFRLGTLLPDPTILGKPDFRSRTSEAGLPEPDSDPAGLTRKLPISPKYTVLFLTIRPFSGTSHYYWDVGTPDSLGIGLSPNSSPKYTVLFLEPIRSLLDPFQASHTIIGTSDSFRLPLTHSELP